MRTRWLPLCIALSLLACDGDKKADAAAPAEGEAAKVEAAAAEGAGEAAADAKTPEVEPAPNTDPAAAQLAAAPSEGDVVIDHEVTNIDGETQKLADYRGKALLIVNTASECGFTPQYTQLQKLHETYADRGLVVLGFPSNEFGGQEPGSHEEIKKFVKDEYGVEFPMFAKVETNGDGRAPLYASLTSETAEHMRGDVKWNFTKFLVDPEGHVVARFESPVDPMSEELRSAVESVLPEADAG